MHTFTKILREKGWTVKTACVYWNLKEDAFYARLRNHKTSKQVECMCNGLPEREK